MNKIYKVVWNTVRNCYVVGSELISSKSGRHSASNGKSSSLKVTLTVLALCGMTALGSGVAPTYAADMGATTARNQYVALKYDSSNNQNETYERINGTWQKVTVFNGQKYIKVNSGVTDTNGRLVYYWVREGYSLTMVDGQPYTSLSSNGRRADVSWTGDANAKPSDILESVTSTHVQTNVTTNVGEKLQQVNAGTYAGVTNSDGTEVAGTWDYIVKDSSWKGVVDASNYSDGYANLISKGKPKGFVTTGADSKLAWNATLNAYTYNGKVVDYSNIYVIDGEIGVFTNAWGSEVYTGTVFGKNNEVLMTVKKSDGKYYSYWGAEVNDAGATMDTYRVAEYQKDLNVLRDNDFALYHNDIKSVDMSTNDSSATISLMRNGDGTTSPAVDGTLTLTNGGGTGGEDTYVRISNTTNGQEVSKTFMTGSKVSAIGSTDATTGLTINGVDYTIKPDVSWTAQAGGKDVNAVNQKVNFVGSDHITVTGTDGQIKFEATGLADTDLTNITNTAVTKIQNIAKGEDVHIKADTYTVGNDGSVTMTYVDGNGNPVTGEAKITGIAKSDLNNITEGGKTVINNLAKEAVKVVDGTNTKVREGTLDNGKIKTYAVDVKTNGTINKGDTNIVTGDTVYNALQNVSWKAQVNGRDAKIVAKDGTLNFVDGNNIAISAENGNIKISTTGLASSGDLWTAQAGGKDVTAVNQKVNFNSTDKHLVVESTKDGEITFATKDLADTSFTNITKEGNTYIKNLAKGEDRHIEAKEYAVGNDGSVTMTYVDGNGNTVDGTAKITGIAKSDLSNITNKGNTVINNIAKNAVKVVGGMNTNVESSTTTDGPVEYKVNLNKDVNLGDTIQLNGSDGSISAKSGGAKLSFGNNGLTVSQAKNGLTNETRINGAEIMVDGGIGNQTTIKGSMARIGSVLVNGGSGTATITGLTNKTTNYTGFANGSGRAATEEQLKEVNSKATAAKTTVTNGKNITVNEAKANDGSSTYTVGLATDVVLGDNAIKLNGSDGSISAKSGGAKLSFNNNGLTVSQAKNGLTNETRINGAEITVDGGIGNQTTIKGSTARIGNVLVNGGSGTATITGLTNKTTDYTGFANGSGRAATEEQLKEVDSKAAAAKTTVTNGKNITVDEAKADDGSSTYTVGLATDVVLGDNAIKLNGSDGSISAKSGGAQLAFNNSGLTVSQAKNGLTNETRIDGATITVDGGTGNQTIINGSTARIGSVLVNGGSGTATITGLTNKTTDYTGFANGSGRAATEEQLKEVAGKAGEAIETAGKGWNLTTNGKEASKTNIAPDGTVDFSSSNDNLIISNAGANLSFSLSDNLDLTKNEANKGSVKVGKNTTLTDGLLQVGNLSLTANALTIDGSTYISASGINANKHKITNVLAGKDDMDAVNVGQLKSAIRDSQVSIKAGDGISVAKTGNQYTINVNIEGVTNNQGKVTVSTGDSTSTESGSESGSSGAKKFKVMDLMYRAESNEVAPETTTDTGKPMKIESIPEDIKLEADDNQAASVVNGETIKIAGDGTNISTKANVTGAGSMDTISVSLKPDIQVDSVTINNGGPTINNTGIDMNGKSITNVENITVNNGPTINSSGIDMNSQKIINLAEGDISETSTDAVNGGQLYNTNQAVIANAENINSLSHSLNKLDSRINRVGAGAAALAALHPLDFDPDNKWDFAAGYGNYAGANAVAIGTYYRPNENTMFSIGGSFGGGENMINAGVSFKLGSGGSGITTSKTVMAKKIKEQDELLKAQDAKMKEQDEKIAKLEALVAQQGEMIQQALGKK